VSGQSIRRLIVAFICTVLVVPLWSSANSVDVECNLATFKLQALERAEQHSRMQGGGWWCGTPTHRAREHKEWVCSQGRKDLPVVDGIN
jgi:hypothetical protein